MAERLQRHLGRVESLEPGQWTDRTATGMPAICCKRCSGITDVTLAYSIDEDGRIAPAWKCEHCSFFDYVHLQAFSEEIVS